MNKHVSIPGFLIEFLILLFLPSVSPAQDLPFPEQAVISFPNEPITFSVKGPFDLSDSGQLNLSYTFKGEKEGKIWLNVYFITDDYLQYQTSISYDVPSKTWRFISPYILPEKNDFEPCGHFKRWDENTSRHIREIGIKLYSQEKAEGTFYIRKASLRGSPSESQLLAYDVTGRQEGRRYEISFISSVMPENPYHYSSMSVSGLLLDSSGNQIARSNGFICQEFLETVHPDRVLKKKVGPLRWKTIFYPPAPGTYSCRINLFRSGSNEITFSVPPFQFEESEAAQKPAVSSPGKYDFSTSFMTLSKLEGKQWRIQKDIPAFDRMWYPVIQWKEGWGYYHGINRFNQQEMEDFDRFLDSAAAPGYLVLLDSHELSYSNDFHWKDNPLNTENAGILEKRSQFFSNADVIDNTKSIIRYMTARWGNHPAIKGLIIANNLPSDKAPQWHEEIASFISSVCRPAVPVYSMHPQPAMPVESEELSPSRKWMTGRTPQATGRIVTFQDQTIVVKGSFPGEIPIARKLKGNWADMDRISFDVETPEKAPEYSRVLLYLRDQDWNWYQKLLKAPLRVNDTTTYVASLTEDFKWDKEGNSCDWLPYTTLRVREIGIRIIGNANDQQCVFGIKNIKVYKLPSPESDTGLINSITLNAKEIPRYKKLEVDFNLTRKYRNPFDPECVAVDGLFTGPDGAQTVMPGFFYKPYSRQMKKGKEELSPDGRSSWKIRFTPVQEGSWSLKIRVKDKKGTSFSEKLGFTCTSSDEKGFIQKSDDRYFEYTNGDFFYPIGIVIRSPADQGREPYKYPFEQFTHKGTYAYDIYFDELDKNLMNWVRVWQCSWWCGLEWRDDWGGFGGIGYYNLENAWRFDYIVDLAEKHGIYLQVDTMNHGQLSLQVDSEWRNNPFNVSRGGFCRTPEDYYSNPEARKYHKNKLRYIIARWGFSPHIMSFGLLTEVEFTGEYWRYAAKHGDPPGTYPKTTSWHKEMGRYLKEIDPYDHMVQTHFSHPQRGSDIWSLPEIDICESNAYTAFQQWGAYRLGNRGDGVVVAIDRYYYNIFRKYNKPVLVGEFGGHWSKNSAKLLDSELHCGTWASVMTPIGGVTGFWWWPHVHYKNTYFEYKSAALFVKGEDMRKLNFQRTWVQVPQNSGIETFSVLGKDTLWSWIYDPRIIARPLNVRGSEVQEQYTEYFGPGIQLKEKSFFLPSAFRNKDVTIEFWNTYTGTIIETRDFSPGISPRTKPVSLPDFRNDIAVKVRVKK